MKTLLTCLYSKRQEYTQVTYMALNGKINLDLNEPTNNLTCDSAKFCFSTHR